MSFSPLIKLVASDNFINDISVGSSSKDWATAMIISPTFNKLSLHTGPPIITSEISTCWFLLKSLAPIPWNLPDIFWSKTSFASGAK